MTTDLLPAIEIETAPNPDATVIWMHGLGDDGRGWSEVVPTLALPPKLAIRFIFPHAPIMPVTINNGMQMRAWYDIRQANLAERADVDGVRRSQAQVGALMAREVERGIAPSRMLLAGFSQGGAIALYAGLRYPQRLAGIVALSTYLVAAERIETEASAANRDVPIFMAHGTHDPVIAYVWAERSRDVLRAGGFDVEWHAYPMEHSAVLEEIQAAGAFIARALAAA
ncbi:MAG TPA: alpha/beta hydrolase-fold protein [Casimicrobiaceae bacterium]|nr:alpha/beta hydrolase-fold protein [Casimicrobiaceae bacterium]